ncbi:PIR Superfamily Protein [Plasmodium ovale wallikeri]|uniref:PIR Superfamily Protein n=1 Tax=Plasmodium ovale wallikeri TaxID=864142 RepID=A0A1A9AL92_PLAOA|nr:PIR Superfamily Protein [Plasmodium ovale wallikeri]SBT57593.1 PIR Superfamily Protein [Plasmodium ovale wallikeri]
MDDPNLYLSSSTNYSVLDNNSVYTKGDGHCAKLENDLGNKAGIKEFCKKLAGNLENFEKLKFYGAFDWDRCTVINYWVHNYIFNIIYKDDTLQSITTALGKVLVLWETFIPRKTCDISSNLNVKANFNDLKKLYDYATNYESLKLYMAGKNNVCTENFKQYIDGMQEIIKNAQSKCASESHDYCFLLNYIKKKYTIESLLELRCVIKASATTRHEAQDQVALITQKPPPLRSRKIAVVAFPILGTIFIFLMLYKFTALGSWLRSQLQKRNIMKHNIDEEENELLGDIYDDTHRNYERSEQYIGYHPERNYR